MRARFTKVTLAALGALTAGALGIAVTLVATDRAMWPESLRPLQPWGWWIVSALLLAAVILAAWQIAHHDDSTSRTSEESTVQVNHSGYVVGRNAGIIGGQAPTGGQDVNTVTGGTAPTAGRDLINLGVSPRSLASPSKVRWPTPDLTISNLPARNWLFTGRDHLLTSLTGDLSTRGIAGVQAKAIYGLGGVGKTHLALEYAYRHAADYDLVWWVTADQPAAIPGQLTALARRLGIPEQPEQAETVAALLDELRRHNRWLIVFDNAEEPRDLRSYWPTGGGGHVLITSRNPNWSGLAATTRVEVWDRSESIAFLRQRASLNSQASTLAEALGDLPLALEQAAAYMEETSTPSGEYLDLLRERGSDMLALGSPATSEQTVSTIWAVSLNRLRMTLPVAEDFLALCAFLGPDDVPRTLLVSHPEVLPEPLAVVVQDKLALQQTLGALRRYSLITITGETVSIHRLVQAVIRDQLDAGQRRQWSVAAARVVLAALPEDVHDFDAWPRTSRLLPHIMLLADNHDVVQAASAVVVGLLNRASVYLTARAEFETARLLAERAVRISEAELGSHDPNTAASLYALALVLHAQGNLPDARTFHERALTIREATLGANHLDTGVSLNDLALVLEDQGEFDRARQLQERVLQIREMQRGPHHPHTAGSLNNLASILHKEGDLSGARSLHERALAIRQANLGDDHPYTAQSLHNLAAIAAAEGDLAGARDLLEHALDIYENRVGPDRPDTALALHNLALVLAAEGSLTHARSLLERALSIYENRLGSGHPDTAGTRDNLAAVQAALENNTGVELQIL